MATAEATRTKTETVTYCDPWATGAAGPHIRYPNEVNEDGTPRVSRRRLTLRNGNATVEVGSLEEQVMRTYLERRYGNPDAFKGETLTPGMRCNCGFATRSQEGATLHEARWPDHKLTIVR